MDLRKIAWRSSLVTSRWTSYGFFLYFCEPFFRFLGGGAATSVRAQHLFEPHPTPLRVQNHPFLNPTSPPLGFKIQGCPIKPPWFPIDPTGARLVLYSGTLVHRYTNTLVHKYTGAQVHWYTGTPVFKYIGTPVQSYTGIPVH